MPVTIRGRSFRTLDDIEEEYLRDHPDEIEAYLAIQFEEYAKDGNAAALLASLRVISRVTGVTQVAKEAGLTRKGVQKALSEEGNPRFDSISAILRAMGYGLTTRKLNPDEGGFSHA